MRNISFDKFIEGCFEKIKTDDLNVAHFSLREYFLIEYGFIKPQDYVISPLITSAMLPQLDMTTGSLLEDLSKDFLRLKIYTEYGISFDRYVELPKSERATLKRALEIVTKERSQGAEDLLKGK